VGPGDTAVLSARAIPGNERAVSRVISSLLRQGCQVIHPGTAKVHVSGHGCRGDLAELIHLTQPQYVVPMHGEYRMLSRMAEVAGEAGLREEQVLVVEDGQALVFDPDGARRDAPEHTGRQALASTSAEVLDEALLRERRQLAREGVVVPIVVRRRGEATLARPPRVVSLGFVDPTESADLLADAEAFVTQIMAGEAAAGPEAALGERLARELRRELKRRTRRRPLVLPVLLEV
jgi:ribonuclease J